MSGKRTDGRLKQWGAVSEETRFECRQCRQMMSQSMLNVHVASCPRREYTCEYCENYTGVFEEVRKYHIPECPRRPILCPNQCRVRGKLQSVQQQAIAEHLRVCPDQGKVDNLMTQLREKSEALENLQKEVVQLREQVSLFQVSV